MSYIQFDKTQLINLEYSLSREVLRSNRAGSFACTTMIFCPTRKYHGLLICPLEDLDGENHILLSAVDETIIQHGKEFHLAVRKYPGRFHPGHKYIRDFHTDPIPTITYRVGGVVLRKETLLAEEDERFMIRYTLEEAHSPTKLRLHPFLAFRQVHKLSKCNMDVNKKIGIIQNGISTKLYEGYPTLNLQLSKKNEFISAPNWYFDIEYIKEKERGYEHHEDLYVPGSFEFSMKKGESIVFSASTSEVPSRTLNRKFNKEIDKRVPRNGFEQCLEGAAQQFIKRNGDRTEIIAGFPWFGTWARDTFIALPGLTLAQGDVATCKAVLDTMSSEMRATLFNNRGRLNVADVNAADPPLWFFWAVQQFAPHSSQKQIWKDYGPKMKRILRAFMQGRSNNVKMHDNGLIYQGEDGKALTWMDAFVHGAPITPRKGYAVEVNALWYNAICFGLELAKANNDDYFISEWKDFPERIRHSFTNIFWNEQRGYLADFIDGDYADWSVRPNQIFAASLPYSMLTEDISKSVVDTVQRELLTPRGLRTLAPKHPGYQGVAAGNVTSKDIAYHQGTVWPWLLGHFAEAYLKLHRRSGVNFIKKIFNGFENELSRHGIGTISEIYDGNPPHEARGAISQAWSVGELLRIKSLLKEYSK